MSEWIMPSRSSSFDYLAIVVCTFAWGTTWYAITLQFGVVDPVVSVAYRFALAAALLFSWCLLRREPLSLDRAQHLAAFGVGFFAIFIDYPLTYWAEQRVVSAVVAVIFAALAFCNLIAFRLAFNQRAPRSAWAAACLGIVGVAVLSWSEIAGAEMNARALIGLAMALGAVITAAAANLFAHRGEEAGAPLAPLMAWAMAYGSALLVPFVFLSGRAWTFDATPRYMLSLLYLAVMGSVVAFLLYFGLARRRGYATASYILALTPLVAMVMSTVFEHKRWGITGLAGVAIVLLGQWLLLRAQSADARRKAAAAESAAQASS
jgi:drug/metabolite transporter (DMT)-like permease